MGTHATASAIGEGLELRRPSQVLPMLWQGFVTPRSRMVGDAALVSPDTNELDKFGGG